jgi:hypothetical protein
MAELRAQLRALQLQLEEERDAKLCAVCLDAPKECALQPCAHACVCAACAATLAACPVCRTPVASVSRVYV